MVRSLFLIVLAATVALAEEEDFYDVLGIPEPKDEASEREIKKQYRTLSRKLHPDVNPSDDAKLRYGKIQRAHEVLSDRRKRKIYDMKGEEGLEQLEKSEAGRGQQDPLAAMFGGGGNNHKGQDVEMTLNVPLAFVFNGHHHSVRLTKQKLCRRCRGSGAADRKELKKCGHCKGKGVVTQRVQLMPGFVQQVQNQCPHCKGSGKIPKNKCPACAGKKVLRGEHNLEVEIERGVPEGHKLVYEMEADQHPDLIPGDVIFKVATKPDATFRRKGNDLESTLRVGLKDALLGFTRHIAHMDGHDVQVTLPMVTHYGQRVKIAGEGMPVHNVPSERGDLYVTVQVDLPMSLTPEQQRALDEVLS